jgi:hypothetical protein
MKENSYELSEEYIRNEEFFLKVLGFRIRFDYAPLITLWIHWQQN